MSHGAKPVIAIAFGLAALLTAGIASANCGVSHSASTSAPTTTDTVSKPDAKVPASTRG